ncbi:peroxiredoxin [Jannaschia seohaensis]|uniref:Glutathione-dependent peroxiredoxin n=1 Tax=Jannaschia seohaensis TaxID=475081 RepID=A0A2Y9C3V6_9RHOB|nr:peroxiredoxin [Jannaschia seohaensis]PWJ22205.1 cytochrome c peroxidase [Jannaschia seohaensis]SSA38483.1 cytochrome c peroxidase [Jannaschia seohaensis]
MTISTGDKLPEANLIRIGGEGPETVSLSELTAGKTVAIFAVPGAFTPTCSAAHVPSYIQAKDQLAEKGVDAIVCISVNDPFVLKAWGEATGATEAGIHMLADADGSFTKAMGLDFDAPPAGLIGRSRRYGMLVEDGTVKALNVEESPGVMEVSDAETLLKTL